MDDLFKPIQLSVEKDYPQYPGSFLIRAWETVRESEAIEVRTLGRLARHGLVGSYLELPTYIRNNAFVIASFNVLAMEEGLPRWFKKIDDEPRSPALQAALESLWDQYETAREELRKKNPALERRESQKGTAVAPDVVP